MLYGQMLVDILTTHHSVVLPNCCHKTGSIECYRIQLYVVALQLSFTETKGSKHVPALQSPNTLFETLEEMACQGLSGTQVAGS